jgi:hypothetical protein
VRNAGNRRIQPDPKLLRRVLRQFPPPSLRKLYTHCLEMIGLLRLSTVIELQDPKPFLVAQVHRVVDGLAHRPVQASLARSHMNEAYRRFVGGRRLIDGANDGHFVRHRHGAHKMTWLSAMHAAQKLGKNPGLVGTRCTDRHPIGLQLIATVKNASRTGCDHRTEKR